MALVLADPVDRRTSLPGERVSFGDCSSGSESGSSARSYIDVARTPPAVPAPSTAAAPGCVAPAARPPALAPARKSAVSRAGRCWTQMVSSRLADGSTAVARARRTLPGLRPRAAAALPPRSSRASASGASIIATASGIAPTTFAAAAASPPVTPLGTAMVGGLRPQPSDPRATPRSCRSGFLALPLPQRRAPLPSCWLQSPPHLPPCWPRTRPPPPPRVFLAQTEEMDEAELVLARAMVASVTGTRPSVSIDEVAALLLGSLELEEGDFTVHQHHPEDFLIIFSSLAIMRRLRGEHFISSGRFSLSLRPWCKLAHAGAGELEYRVELELCGIPAHAWLLSTAEHLLGDCCWIERLHPRTRSRDDMAVFRVSGRAHNPAAIRRAAVLEIVEQLPGRVPSKAPAVRTLTFPVAIALTKAELIRPAPAAAHSSDNGGEADDATGRHGPGPSRGQGPGNGRARRRGRKRRRTDGAPAGRMAWQWTLWCSMPTAALAAPAASPAAPAVPVRLRPGRPWPHSDRGAAPRDRGCSPGPVSRGLHARVRAPGKEGVRGPQ
ncbi:hypothetical protein D1007_53057 [Hordeum vulgare]|nr:hypothetical protein D1007_53057 [Hordeum vulgare]